MEYLSLRSNSTLNNKLYLAWSFGWNTGLLLYLPYCVVAASRLSSTLPSAGIYTQTLVFQLFLKLVIKPDSLLLEDHGRSQTSGEGQNQTSPLPLFFDLDPVDIYNVKMKSSCCLKTKAAFTRQTKVGKLVLANPSWCV